MELKLSNQFQASVALPDWEVLTRKPIDRHNQDLYWVVVSMMCEHVHPFRSKNSDSSNVCWWNSGNTFTSHIRCPEFKPLHGHWMMRSNKSETRVQCFLSFGQETTVQNESDVKLNITVSLCNVKGIKPCSEMPRDTELRNPRECIRNGKTPREMLEGLQNPGVQIACGENLVDLEYADDIVLMFEEEEKAQSVLFSMPNLEWRKQRGGQPLTCQRSMKEIKKRLGSTRLPGWGPRDPHCAWLETLQDMAANRCQWRSCCRFLSRLPELSNKSWLYGSEASVLNTDVMLSMMMMMMHEWLTDFH
ncbi:hypothetical protein T265_06816 [Opisthorchis viverrini]|uniref:Uncharacterized protein n=1 Tax=Opisthorchis viverrini TaxID=6198 RepID=A0A074ZER1_OPIVI|nr:hypothetical protein T265_06816 [Opisthorchis viverrini]KER25781.1 hypothetical protein T265_06816 [Opisthorchis viverrini]